MQLFFKGRKAVFCAMARMGLSARLGRMMLLSVLFLFPSAAFADDSTWSGVQRIVAVGDVHGDYEQLVEVLRSAEVINKRSKWTGAKTHLVQIGDLPDRGPDTRKILDLFMKLETEARRAGGAVHALIGNHEAMNIYGDLRYVTPEEFASFRDANSEGIRAAFYKKHLEQLAAAAAEDEKNAVVPDEAYRKAWEKKYPLGYFEHRFQFGPNGKYGKWIEAHNTIILINDTLFVHGGISPKYADFSLETINNRIREELRDFSMLKGGIAMDPDGPLWYRGLARDEETALGEHVDRLLKMHGARRIVVGHTPTDGAVIPRFGGKVLLIDVGLSAYYGARLACLLIEGDNAYAIHRGKRLPIPSDSGLQLLQYLKHAAALDPKPSPLINLISETESRLAVPEAVQ
jgi:hypothetical protein